VIIGVFHKQALVRNHRTYCAEVLQKSLSVYGVLEFKHEKDEDDCLVRQY